ncbi:hypothetical protein [Moorena sp. SIO4G3]|uniref:hypothetical protein n=1 Tax=Moorena sp. SIO4G3 TaxID=2607821 RepID=UPI00142BAA9F|nr:hypothetical protein [Moorena sp. SIO4G3]NEO81484.1 hypothetical protein [Moorena sp. SIO4G3]
MGSAYQDYGQLWNLSGALPTLHQLHELPVPCSLFPVPCSHQSYIHISNTNAIVWIY